MSAASHLARRAAQKERVRILYRRALKETLNWAVHRHLFYQDASELRERFEANKNVENLEAIDRLIADGEASHNKWRHPDPTLFHGLLVAPSSPEIQHRLLGLR
nr:LYR motif-containing protein [Providencia sp. PROV137]